MSTLWPAPDVEKLTRLWRDGVSASQIGAALGRSVKSVRVKASRLGLSGRSPQTHDRADVSGGGREGIAFKPWTNYRHVKLIQMQQAGCEDHEIAAELGMEVEQVRMRIATHNLGERAA